MRSRNLLTALVALLTLMSMGYAFQRSGRGFFDDETPIPIPPDANEKTEYQFARLRYPNFQGVGGLWAQRGNWTVDYPKADRQFLQGVRRLSRIHARSMEAVV